MSILNTYVEHKATIIHNFNRRAMTKKRTVFYYTTLKLVLNYTRSQIGKQATVENTVMKIGYTC